jgi:hypothetical protein
MNKYLIRYNTYHGESNLVWRVFENGEENLVRDFHIKVPVYSEATLEHGVQKWNVACQGNMIIENDIAYII